MSEYMIMINSICNLDCPYCFAKNSMKSSRGEISEESFKKAVEFRLLNSKSAGIGIIGGEPTLHSKFDFLIRNLINDDRVESIDIFTNGTTLRHHLPVFSDKKVFTLINCNPISITGEKLQSEIIKGLDLLFEIGVPLSRVGFGFNLFNPTEALDYYLYLIERYRMDTVRLSVSVPNSFVSGGNGRFQFFSQYLEQTKSFVRELLDREVVPIFDCNKIPPCLLFGEKEELKNRYKNRPGSMNALMKSNYLNGYAHCSPSIVVDKNLNAIRCFALSEITREYIFDFDSLRELQHYYEKGIDMKGYYSDHINCENCDKLIKRQCMGGCLIFKV